LDFEITVSDGFGNKKEGLDSVLSPNIELKDPEINPTIVTKAANVPIAIINGLFALNHGFGFFIP
jgi:hypothetical protein